MSCAQRSDRSNITAVRTIYQENVKTLAPKLLYFLERISTTSAVYVQIETDICCPRDCCKVIAVLRQHAPFGCRGLARGFNRYYCTPTQFPPMPNHSGTRGNDTFVKAKLLHGKAVAWTLPYKQTAVCTMKNRTPTARCLQTHVYTDLLLRNPAVRYHDRTCNCPSAMLCLRLFDSLPFPSVLLSLAVHLRCLRWRLSRHLARATFPTPFPRRFGFAPPSLPYTSS